MQPVVRHGVVQDFRLHDQAVVFNPKLCVDGHRIGRLFRAQVVLCGKGDVGPHAPVVFPLVLGPLQASPPGNRVYVAGNVRRFPRVTWRFQLGDL